MEGSQAGVDDAALPPVQTLPLYPLMPMQRLMNAKVLLLPLMMVVLLWLRASTVAPILRADRR